MNRRIAAATAALAVVALAPAGAVVADQMMADHVTVSGAAPSVTTPTSPSTGSSGNGSGSSADGGNGSGNSGNSGNSNPLSPWSQATTSRTSGTPVSSWPGVVMVDTAMQGGEGAGTGIVLSSDGIVLTNYHVVDGSTAIRVKASNGSTYSAKVLGFDQTHDVAVIKLEGANGLQKASLDTGKALLGEQVTAVGQGGGKGTLYKISGTVTGLNQRITASDGGTGASAETLTGMVKTNAQIVPGYSGGPLLDASGRVIGMDTAASSSTPIAGYAIPTSKAIKIANQIESGTKTSSVHIGKRAALGVEISTQHSTGFGFGGGASVVGVSSGGAAASAGITAGSTITAINGKQVAGPSTLTGVLDTKYPGDKVSVTWIDAQGQSHTATVTLGVSPEN